MSVSLGAGETRLALSYQGIIPQIYAIADAVALNGYKMHGDWTGHTGIHSALYNGPYDPTNYNGDFALNLLLANGGVADRTLLGVPSFGVGFTLVNPIFNGIGAPTTAVTPPDTPNRIICQRLRVGTLTPVWDDTQVGAYAFDGTFWVGFESLGSAETKAHYINARNLLGAKCFVLDDDDYSGICEGPTIPLFRLINDIINPTN